MIKFRWASVLLLASVLTVSSLSSVLGADRDDWLRDIQKQAEALKGSVGESADSFRAVAVVLADSLNRFGVNETEIRSETKLGPPDNAFVRPGAVVTSEETQPGINTVDLKNVSLDWFNLYLTKAEAQLRSLVEDLDQGTAVQRDNILNDPAFMDRIDQFVWSVQSINRPPQ